MTADRDEQPRRRKPEIPPASSEAAKRRMHSAKGKDTAAELAVRSVLDGLGLRYETDQRLIPGTQGRADLAFFEARVAVFVDGCFWHGCPQHGSWPKQNAAWWREKIETNRRRDANADQRLRDAGWLVIRVWEHEDPQVAARQINNSVRSRCFQIDPSAKSRLPEDMHDSQTPTSR